MEKKKDNLQFFRGSIWYIDLKDDPNQERIQGIQYGRRPILIISNDMYNTFSPNVTYVTISRTENHSPVRVEILLDETVCYVQCENIFTTNKKFLKDFKGKLSDMKMLEVENALVLQMHLEDHMKRNYSFDKLDEMFKAHEEVINKKYDEQYSRISNTIKEMNNFDNVIIENVVKSIIEKHKEELDEKVSTHTYAYGVSTLQSNEFNKMNNCNTDTESNNNLDCNSYEVTSNSEDTVDNKNEIKKEKNKKESFFKRIFKNKSNDILDIKKDPLVNEIESNKQEENNTEEKVDIPKKNENITVIKHPLQMELTDDEKEFLRRKELGLPTDDLEAKGTKIVKVDETQSNNVIINKNKTVSDVQYTSEGTRTTSRYNFTEKDKEDIIELYDLAITKEDKETIVKDYGFKDCQTLYRYVYYLKNRKNKK